MRFGTISGNSGSMTFTPNFPSTSTPIIFLSAPQSTLTNQMWSMQVSAVSYTGFTYVKQYFAVSGGSISGSGSFGETISYMAIG